MATELNSRGSLYTDPVRNFRFLVSFYPTVYPKSVSKDEYYSPAWKPSGRFGFSSVSGLSFNVNVQTIREGGYNTTVHQVPTRVDFSAVQFDRGVALGTSQNWDWMRMLLRVARGKANRPQKALFRSDVEIAVFSHPVPYSNGGTSYGGSRPEDRNIVSDDFVAMRFRLYNAWPSSVVYSDLNAGDNALLVERMTLVHEGLDLVWARTGKDGSEPRSAYDFGNSKTARNQSA